MGELCGSTQGERLLTEIRESPARRRADLRGIAPSICIAHDLVTLLGTVADGLKQVATATRLVVMAILINICQF